MEHVPDVLVSSRNCPSKQENNTVLREYHKWHSPSLNREMELLTFGHAGARVLIFPTSMGRYFDWENRGMMQVLQQHLDNGWLQVFCVDSVDNESWYNDYVDGHTKAARHLQYQDYIINEVLPFTKSKNDNGFLMAVGASFGAYHAISIAVRFPHLFHRAIGMSGMYDVRRWTHGQYDSEIHESNPYEYVRCLDNRDRIVQMQQVDWIIPIGQDDPSFENNRAFSQVLWDKGIWHAFRVWNGNAHDWPYWQDMLLHYIGGPDSRG
jgi:esterase/lipase superfamily enzyme